MKGGSKKTYAGNIFGKTVNRASNSDLVNYDWDATGIQDGLLDNIAHKEEGFKSVWKTTKIGLLPIVESAPDNFYLEVEGGNTYLSQGSNGVVLKLHGSNTVKKYVPKDGVYTKPVQGYAPLTSSRTRDIGELKMIPQSHLNNEAKIAHKLVGIDNVVKIKGVILKDDGINVASLFMEYEPDGNFQNNIIKKNIVTNKQIHTVSKALQELHDRGIVHNDIKPDNLLVHKDGLKIADFGLASPLKSGEEWRKSLDVMNLVHSIVGSMIPNISHDLGAGSNKPNDWFNDTVYKIPDTWKGYAQNIYNSVNASDGTQEGSNYSHDTSAISLSEKLNEMEKNPSIFQYISPYEVK